MTDKPKVAHCGQCGEYFAYTGHDISDHRCEELSFFARLRRIVGAPIYSLWDFGLAFILGFVFGGLMG